MRKTIVIWGLIAIAVVVLIMKSMIPGQKSHLSEEEIKILWQTGFMENCMEKDNMKFCDCVYRELLTAFGGLDGYRGLAQREVVLEDDIKIKGALNNCYYLK